jgi:hypothetical protein
MVKRYSFLNILIKNNVHNAPIFRAIGRKIALLTHCYKQFPIFAAFC